MNLYRIATHPVTILGSVSLGLVMGETAPELSQRLGATGQIYIELLRMMVLPFLMSAVVLSIYRLTSNADNARFVGRILTFLFAAMTVTGVAGIVIVHFAAPGAGMDAATMDMLGRLLNKETVGTEPSITLLSVAVPPEPRSMLTDLIARMVPGNIFHALSVGDILKTLFFAVVFGVALAHTPKHLVGGILNACDAVFFACQRLTIWVLHLLPPVTTILVAEQIAKAGFEPFIVMTRFIAVYAVVTALLLVLCILIIQQRSRHSLGRVLASQKEPFVLALATGTSACCMPSMLTAMVDKLHFDKTISELLVPLGTSLLRVGSVLFYATATVFIAQLYGREMMVSDYALVLVASLFTGFASAGMTGILTVTQASVVCALLGLPFEVAFILFVAVEPLCNPLRTTLLVTFTNAMVAMIAPRAADMPEHIVVNT